MAAGLPVRAHVPDSKAPGGRTQPVQPPGGPWAQPSSAGCQRSARSDSDQKGCIRGLGKKQVITVGQLPLNQASPVGPASAPQALPLSRGFPALTVTPSCSCATVGGCQLSLQTCQWALMTCLHVIQCSGQGLTGPGHQEGEVLPRPSHPSNSPDTHCS